MQGIAFPFKFHAEGKLESKYNEEIILDKRHLFCLTHESERVMYYDWSAGLGKILFSSFDASIRQALLYYELNLKMHKFFPYLTLNGIYFEDQKDGVIKLYIDVEEIEDTIILMVED